MLVQDLVEMTLHTNLSTRSCVAMNALQVPFVTVLVQVVQNLCAVFSWLWLWHFVSVQFQLHGSYTCCYRV